MKKHEKLQDKRQDIMKKYHLNGLKDRDGKPLKTSKIHFFKVDKTSIPCKGKGEVIDLDKTGREVEK